jgi:hypothetical protein
MAPIAHEILPLKFLGLRRVGLNHRRCNIGNGGTLALESRNSPNPAEKAYPAAAGNHGRTPARS